MYSRTMHRSFVDAVEVEDAADVLVVEHRVPPGLLHEEGNQGEVVRVEELLDHHRTLEAGLAGQARAVDATHAASSQLLLEDILAWHGVVFPSEHSTHGSPRILLGFQKLDANHGPGHRRPHHRRRLLG